jgi:polysaccharide export outer membrane protein
MNSAHPAPADPEANMFRKHRPEPTQAGLDHVSPAGGIGRSGRIAGGAALGAAFFLTACVAPGMKLDSRPSGIETTQFDGLKVTLRPLTPQVVLAQRAPEPVSLAGLLVEKVQPYRVGPQDILLVTVWDHPEITLPLGQFRTDGASGSVIDEDGNLYFPYIGKVSVSGMTIAEVRDKLTLQLGQVLQKPQVDVKVLAYRAQKVYVGGEVRNPAIYNVTDVPFTLSEAIARAGGFLSTADDSRMVLTRGDRTWKLNFQALMASGNRLSQIVLKDGDALHVPNGKEEPIYMLGEVVRPGTLPLVHGNLSLAQALSEAGGIQGLSADARSIYVIRPAGATDSVDVFHLDARNPTAMVMADRFLLGPRDIVYVDAGTLVRFSRVMNMLLPTVSAVSSTALTATYFRNR